MSPYFGPYCDSRLFIRTTVSVNMTYTILSLSFFTGFLLAYFLKLVFDIVNDVS
jgi:hypothetical protein